MHTCEKKNEVEELMNGGGKMMVKLCNLKGEGERIKYMMDYKNGNAIMDGNLEIKCRNKVYETSISEVIKNIE